MTRTTEATGDAGLLVPVPGFPFPVLTSPGLEYRARQLAGRCASAYRLLAEALDSRPRVTLHVLSKSDWRPPLPYGMPHFTARTLVLAGEEAQYWRSFISVIDRAPPAARAAAVAVYGADLRLAPFFDLLAVHEMGHAFHDSGRSPRRWLDETFANVCLHAYVVAAEPSALPALRAFPEVVVSVPEDMFDHRTLADFEALYSRMDPLNYGWYQCHFHRKAERVHDAGGIAALRRIDSLASPPDVTDAVLADELRRHVGDEIADVLLDWPAN